MAMSAERIDRKLLALLESMSPDEKEVYWEACLDFSENRTFRHTTEPLRSQLMHEYGEIAVARYRREKHRRNRKRSVVGA